MDDWRHGETEDKKVFLILLGGRARYDEHHLGNTTRNNTYKEKNK